MKTLKYMIKLDQLKDTESVSVCWKQKLTVAYFKMISARSSAIRVSMSFFMSISVERGKKRKNYMSWRTTTITTTQDDSKKRTQLIDVGDCWPPTG